MFVSLKKVNGFPDGSCDFPMPLVLPFASLILSPLLHHPTLMGVTGDAIAWHLGGLVGPWAES